MTTTPTDRPNRRQANYEIALTPLPSGERGVLPALNVDTDTHDGRVRVKLSDGEWYDKPRHRIDDIREVPS